MLNSYQLDITKMKKTVLFFFLVFNLLSQCINAQTIIDDVTKVADKIISETSFEFENRIQTADRYLQIIDFDRIATDDQKIFLCQSFLDAESDKEYQLNVSSNSKVEIFVNGELVIDIDEPDSRFQVLAYDMYSFPKSYYLKVAHGTNRILIKTAADKETKIILAFLQKDNMLDQNVSFTLKPLFNEDKVYSNWVFVGPIDESEKAFKIISENDIPNTSFSFDGEIYSWFLPPNNLIQKDVIKKDYSFNKHSYFDWHYANGQMLLGMLYLYDLTKNPKYVDHVKKFCDLTLTTFDYFKYQFENLNELNGFNHRLFRRVMLDDTGAPALPFIELYTRKKLDETKFLIDIIADYVNNKQVRLEDGTFCRPEPTVMTVWADDLFMSVPFLIRYAKLSGESNYYDDAAKQILLFYEKLFDRQTQLYYHGWFSNDKTTSVAHWGRANGWVIWAITEALLYLPKEHNDYSKILDIYKNHIQGLIPFQNENGRWHQVIDKPGSYEETSSTAMFTLAIARGVLNNWLDESYTQYAINGWNGIADKIKDDGTVEGICRGTGIGFDFEFYFNRETPDNDPRGLGAVLTAGVEVSKLIEK